MSDLPEIFQEKNLACPNIGKLIDGFVSPGSGKKSYICGVCNKKLKSKEELVSHVKNCSDIVINEQN